MKVANKWQLQSQRPVNGERAHDCAVEQEAKAIGLLTIDLLEVVTA